MVCCPPLVNLRLYTSSSSSSFVKTRGLPTTTHSYYEANKIRTFTSVVIAHWCSPFLDPLTSLTKSLGFKPELGSFQDVSDNNIRLFQFQF